MRPEFVFVCLSRSFCPWNREFSVRIPHAKASHIAGDDSQCEVKNYTAVTLVDPLNRACSLSTDLRFLVDCSGSRW